MSRKLNSFILPENVIRTMELQLEDTETLGTELGFSLCKKDSELVDRSHCEGDQCGIELKKICDQGESYMGTYHTHPGSSSRQSIRDMLGTYIDGLGCIGGTEDQSIKCYLRKDKIQKPENIRLINAVIDNYVSPLNNMTIMQQIITEKGIFLRKELSKAEKHLAHLFDTIIIE